MDSVLSQAPVSYVENPPSNTSLPHLNDDARLDAALRNFAIGNEVDIERLLQGAAFDRIVGAIERAAGVLSGQADILLYQAWIAVNAATSPLVFAAWFNLGVALARNGDRANAAVAYRNALVLKPNFHSAAINLGLALEAMGQHHEALLAWDSALQPLEARLALLTQKGRLLERMGRLDEAEAILRGLLVLNPDQPDVIHHWIHIRQKACMWPAIPPDMPGLPPEHLMRHSGPLGVLALTDDIAMQLETASSWVSRKTKLPERRLSPPEGYRHERIRVGYLSSDFCRHAMSYLIAELFERHDRTRFEIFGYCSSQDDGSALRRRVIDAFDRHRPIRHLSDEAAAALIRSDEIDILIDLNGITDGTRLPVLRWRPAPVQATYLGFIGSVPLAELDFLFCDDFVIPATTAASYSPRPLPIGAIYQANDSKRVIGRALSRQEVRLPDHRFVFCCFSNHYKITAEMFNVWISILQGAPDSVLWLATDNVWSQRNLLAVATEAGIDADRLIFAERASPDMYMSRLCLADLYLDTFPYNAGTIASDAIRMGLPLLTRSGRSFASRMAGSLLTSIGAEEGITHDVDAYVAKATRWATDPECHAAFRARFGEAAWRDGLGNIERFTRTFEVRLAEIVRIPRYAAVQH